MIVPSICASESEEDETLPIIEVRLGEIVPHERPNPRRVAQMVAHLRAGGRLPRIEIHGVKRNHWTQGPRSMEVIGYGYGLLGGHHRHAALRQVYGDDHIVQVRARGVVDIEREQAAPQARERSL